MLLNPQVRLRQYEDVTPEFCLDHGISLILCDLDYTLAPKSQKEPGEGLVAWIRLLEQEEITVMIVSNNRSSKRVKRFCSQLGISYVGHAGKPSPRGALEAMKKAGKKKTETAMLGDKLLTDTLSGHLAGITTWVVEPRGGTKTLWQKILYLLQEPWKRGAKESLL